MKLNINGESKVFKEIREGSNLLKVIEQLGYNPKLIVVEFNGEILNTKLWVTQPVKEDDNIEIVTIVGGGS